jgi:hypothetical protein
MAHGQNDAFDPLQTKGVLERWELPIFRIHKGTARLIPSVTSDNIERPNLIFLKFDWTRVS